MEVAGLAIGAAGLAGLFSTCLHVVEKVDSYTDFKEDVGLLVSQFEADRILFQKWGRDVGFVDGRLKDEHHKGLDDPEVRTVIEKILVGIKDAGVGVDGSPSFQQLLPGSVGNPKQDGTVPRRMAQYERLVGPTSRKTKIGWALRSRARFLALAGSFGNLVDRLYRLVPPQGATGGPKRAHQPGPLDDAGRVDLIPSPAYQQTLLALMKKEVRRELDSWLGASYTKDMHKNPVQKRLQGTCGWVLDRPEFLHWESADFPSGAAKLLWIHGPAGYGKTVLCASVIEHLLSVPHTAVACFFFSAELESRNDLFIILRSWISQVVDQNQQAFELACGRWEAHEGGFASPNEIVELFEAIVHSIPDMTFVVDGLDEYREREGCRTLARNESVGGLLKTVKEAISCSKSRVLVVSRDEQDIGAVLRSAEGGGVALVEYRVRRRDVTPDVAAYSQNIIERELPRRSKEHKDELSQMMVGRSDSMFMWVAMLVGHLNRWKTQKQLQQIIQQAPAGLDGLYERNWAQISRLAPDNRRRAFSILRWVAFGLRPLTVAEIAEGLLLADDDCDDIDEGAPDEIDEQYIQEGFIYLCGSLIETQGALDQGVGSQTIHLRHFSIRQYILHRLPVPGGQLVANERLAHSNEANQANVLAIICIRYLGFPHVWDDSWQADHGNRAIKAFRDYATESWHQHVKPGAVNYEDTIKFINIFFHQRNAGWEGWRRAYDTANEERMLGYEGEVTSASPLFYASILGLSETVSYLMATGGLGVDHCDESNRTALLAASGTGYLSLVKELVEMGANVDIASKQGRTSIYIASSNGHVEVVKLLLDNGANLAIATKYGWTPIKAASANGYVEVVKLLLDNGADLAVADKDGWTPIKAASANGYVEVVKLLLDKGADLAVADNDGWTPIKAASANGHIEVVQLLLDKGADHSVASSDGRTPLGWACYSGLVIIVWFFGQKNRGGAIQKLGGRGCHSSRKPPAEQPPYDWPKQTWKKKGEQGWGFDDTGRVITATTIMV